MLSAVSEAYPYQTKATVPESGVTLGYIDNQIPYILVIRDRGNTGIVSLLYIKNTGLFTKVLLDADGNLNNSISNSTTFNNDSVGVKFTPESNRTNVNYKFIRL